MAGVDIPFPALELTIHVPTIREIAMMGEANFFQAVQYICLDKDYLIQDKNISSVLTNFQILMKVLNQSQDAEKKRSVVMLLKLLFPDRAAAITKNSIILTAIGTTNQPILIDDNNFDAFQGVLKTVLCVNSLFQGNNVVYNPANAAAQKIVDKIMEGRRKVAAQKNGATGESALTRYLSILSVGLHLPISNCSDMNMFQLFDLIERYTAQIEWDTDLRVRLAGGKPDKPVESWMRDLHPTL